MIYAFFLQTISNYWTRLSQISWFVSGDQISHLPKPKAEASNWPARHRRITIFCDNRVQLLFYHSISKFFFMNIFGKRSDLLFFFSRKNDWKKEKSVVSFTHEQNIICSRTQLDDIAHEQTIILRQLFRCHVVGFGLMKWKKNSH